MFEREAGTGQLIPVLIGRTTLGAPVWADLPLFILWHRITNSKLHRSLNISTGCPFREELSNFRVGGACATISWNQVFTFCATLRALDQTEALAGQLVQVEPAVARLWGACGTGRPR